MVVLFFDDQASTEIYTYCHTLSLHDALPISGNTDAYGQRGPAPGLHVGAGCRTGVAGIAAVASGTWRHEAHAGNPDRRHGLARAAGASAETACVADHDQPRHRADRKSTRLNSSH